MSKLIDFKLLSFDVYGTLIDWERGVLNALEPALKAANKTDLERKHILQVVHVLESAEEAKNPGKKFADSLATIHPQLCKELGLKEPTAEESKDFGGTIGKWPAFPDSVAALKRLSKHFKLVVLSNVDNESFREGNAGGLEGFKFDAVYTAEDIGTYKPDLKNFEYMLKHVENEFGVEKDEVLQ